MIGKKKNRLLQATSYCTLAMVGFVSAALADGVTIPQLSGIQQLLAYKYEGGSAGFTAVNASTHALGAFQMTPVALRDMGVIDRNGNYIVPNKYGFTGDQQLLASPAAQVALDNDYNAKNMGYLQGAMAKYGGVPATSAGGTPMTPAAQIYCAEALGPGGCAQYLHDGTIPQNVLDANKSYANGGFEKRMGVASATQDGSSIDATGRVTSPGNPGGIVAQVEAMYCNPDVKTMMVRSSEAYVNSVTALATNKGTGFSTLGGGSVLDFAGLGSSGGPGAFGSGNSFRGLSCLDNLLNGGMNVIFEPPNLSSILGMLEQAICTKASSLMAEVTQPIEQSLLGSTGAMSSMGGFFPGLGLGSMLGGVNVAPGGSGVNVGVGSGGNSTGFSLGSISNGYADTSWYGKGSVGTFAGLPVGNGNVTLLNGLFGDTQASNGTAPQGALGNGIFGN